MNIKLPTQLVLDAAKIKLRRIGEARDREWESAVQEAMQPRRFLWFRWQKSREEAEKHLMEEPGFISEHSRIYDFTYGDEASTTEALIAAATACPTETIELSLDAVNCIRNGLDELKRRTAATGEPLSVEF
jgi:hypothetical protein